MKRCVLRLRLNCYKLSVERISSGSAFQSLAEATENDLEPYLVHEFVTNVYQTMAK